MSKKIWKEIPNYEGYEASNDGLIRSVDRISSNGRNLKGKLLSQSNHYCGYKLVSLCKNGISKSFKVHRLIMEAFLGKAPDGYVVDHIDGCASNNSINNLQYITQRQNVAKGHTTKGGTSKYIGVSLEKKTGKWVAQIHIKGKQIYIGSFKSELEAHEAYQKALREVL